MTLTGRSNARTPASGLRYLAIILVLFLMSMSPRANADPARRLREPAARPQPIASEPLRHAAPAAAPIGVGGDDYPLLEDANEVDLEIASNGDAYVAYERHGSNWEIHVLRSKDGGATWSTFGVISTPGDDVVFDDMVIAEGFANRVFIFFSEMGIGSYVARAELAATTAAWTEVEIFPGLEEPRSPRAVSDAIDFESYYLYAVCHAVDLDGTGLAEIWFTRSVDFGASWQPAYVISGAPGIGVVSPAIAHGAGQALHAAWTVSSTSPPSDGVYYRQAANYGANIGSWGIAPTFISSTAGGSRESGVRIAASSGSEVMITHGYLEGEPTVHALYSTDAGATWPSGSAVDLGFDSDRKAMDLDYLVATNEFVAGGTTFVDGYMWHGFRAAIATVPGAFGSLHAFGSAPMQASNWSKGYALAFDPTRGSRVAQAWTRDHASQFVSEEGWFDAEWRSDPSWPNLQTYVSLGTPDIGERATAPAFIQANADPFSEIVFSDARGRIHVTSFVGMPLPGWPIDLGAGSWRSSVAAGDLDGDMMVEIVAADAFGQVHAFDVTGWPLPGFPRSLGVEAPIHVMIASLGGADPRNILAGTEDRLYILDAEGNDAVPPKAFIDTYVAPPAVGDVDADGTPEIVSAVGTRVFVHRIDEFIAMRAYPGQSLTSVSLGDLDLNGDLEIVVASAQGRVYVLEHDLSDYVGIWPFDNASGGASHQVAIAQIVGDARPELALVQTNGVAWVLFDDGDQQSGYPMVVTPIGGTSIRDGTILEGIDPERSRSLVFAATDGTGWSFTNLGGNSTGWPRRLGDVCYATPGAEDIDLDGHMEIVFITQSTLEIYDINYSTGTDGARRWPVKGYNAARTSCANCDDSIVSVDAMASTLDAWTLARPFPNPAGAEGAELRFFVPQNAASATLDVFDVSGRLVRTLDHRGGASGERVAYFDGRDNAGRDVAAGVYVVRLTVVGADGLDSRQQKLSLIR